MTFMKCPVCRKVVVVEIAPLDPDNDSLDQWVWQCSICGEEIEKIDPQVFKK
jgi:transcription elongation factor Elf1